MYFDQHCTDNNFHKVSSGSSNGDEDDFAQTYCGEESGEGTKADNKYSLKALGKDAQATSFQESKHKFKAFCRDQWARASSDSRVSSQRDKDHVQLKPHSLEPSERTNQVTNPDYQQQPAALYSNIPSEPRIVSHARLSNSLNNSNSLISGSGQAGGLGTVNFSQTVNELSAILPPKHNNNSKVKRGTSLRGNQVPQAQISTAINVFNDYTTASIDDPSRHILSREVDDEGQMILQDFSAADGLQSSYARRCQESAAAANQSNHLVARPVTTYNPFRSKSTPPLPMQSSNSADLNRINFLPGGPASRQHSSTSNTMEQQDTSNFMLRKTSSGQILQGKQSRQIEELEKVISEKMGMIKQIDHMIQVNQVKKQTQRQVRAHSTPQLPNRYHPTESPLKSTISPSTHDKQNYHHRRPHQRGGPSTINVSKSKQSRVKEISQSKIVLLQKKKNRYKAKLIALRQHAQMQEQQILRLSQNLTGVESQACTVRNENEQIQNQLIQLQKEFAQQSQEMTMQQAELQSAEQLIQQLKLQMNQRGDTLLEIKHEHTDLQINNRQLLAELQDKEHELQAIQEDFQKAMQENQAFSDKYKEQEQALAELRDVNLQTQDEFDAFRADMETKNDLIGQLKEQIKEITDDHFKEKEKVKRTTEIDQLKELIAQMTTQMLDRSKKDRSKAADGSKQLQSKGRGGNNASQISGLYPTLGLQQTQQHLEQGDESEADCTEAEEGHNQDHQDADYSEQNHQDQSNVFKKHHLRAVSCATQTELFTSQEICSCCQPADEPLANHHLHDSCCQFSQEQHIIQSPQSLNHNHHRSGKSEDRLPLHNNHHMRLQQLQHHQRTNSKNNVKVDSSTNVRGNHGDKVTGNPYKRRSSSVQSPASSNSRCCSKNSQTSRSPVHRTQSCQCQQIVKNKTATKSRKDKSPVSTKLLSLQVQKQQDLDRIKELEGFCTELVKQVEHWRRLDKSGRLINSRIEEHLISHQMPILAATGPMAPQAAASQTIFSQ